MSTNIYNPYLNNYGNPGSTMPMYPQQIPYQPPPQLPNNNVLQTTQEANNFQNFLSNLQSALLNGNNNTQAQNNDNIMAMLSGMLQNPQNQETIRNVINSLQGNTTNTGNEKNTNKTIDPTEKVQVSKGTTKSEQVQGSGQENIISLMMEMIKSQNRNQESSPDEIENKILDIYAYKAMDTLISKTSGSKPVDAKYIAQSAFDIAQAMIAERQNRISSNKFASSFDSDPVNPPKMDDTISKAAQEHIINNL